MQINAANTTCGIVNTSSDSALNGKGSSRQPGLQLLTNKAGLTPRFSSVLVRQSRGISLSAQHQCDWESSAVAASLLSTPEGAAAGLHGLCSCGAGKSLQIT